MGVVFDDVKVALMRRVYNPHLLGYLEGMRNFILIKLDRILR